MTEALYGIMRIIAKIHNYILHLNDKFEYNFSDKDLHFLVIGLIGMAMVFVVYPFFKWLAAKKHVMVIAWIYVFTLILVITFAIEIGQKISNTGTMDFADIVFGVMGFIVMFAVFAVIRGIYHGIRWILTHKFVEKNPVDNDNDNQNKIQNESRNNAQNNPNEGQSKIRNNAQNSQDESQNKIWDDVQKSPNENKNKIRNTVQKDKRTDAEYMDRINRTAAGNFDVRSADISRANAEKASTDDKTVDEKSMNEYENNFEYRNYEYEFSDDDMHIIADLADEESEK